jgi:hypothetical protein
MAFSRKDIRQVEGDIELKNAIKSIVFVLTWYGSLGAGKSDIQQDYYSVRNRNLKDGLQLHRYIFHLQMCSIKKDQCDTLRRILWLTQALKCLI